MRILFSFFIFCFIFSCSKSDVKLSSVKVEKMKKQTQQLTQTDVRNMKKKITFSPQKGDISPQGFNWVHYDFAAFFSGAFYEHGFVGKYREDVLKKRIQQLKKYLKSLEQVKREDFSSWSQKHKTSFLINTYHANLIKLMINRDFKKLEQQIYKIPDQVKIFNNSYSLEQFVSKEVINNTSDYLIAFALKCFELNCPEFRNTIYNFKNVDSLVRVSAVRYFLNTDLNYKNKTIKLPYIQSLFQRHLPKTKNDLIKDVQFLLKNVKSGTGKFPF